jgi:hypothetical protein
VSYRNLLKKKAAIQSTADDIIISGIHNALFGFQSDCVEMLLKVKRGAAFLDTGLGKTLIQCEWARHIPGNTLFIAPLAVANQTIDEAKKHLGMDIVYSKTGDKCGQYTITNYDRIDRFDPDEYDAVVLDESSILKGVNSKTKSLICEMFNNTKYKLACTATPAPNDYTELGNHAEFLGIMTTQEMLSRWFVHDSANTSDWRLKGHAVKPFWQWVSSWAACVSKPSDLGYSNEGYDLPPLKIHTHRVCPEIETAFDKGMLFDIPDSVNATSLHREKRNTVDERVAIVAHMVNQSIDPWIVWCESNQESEMLSKSIPDAVEVKGSDDADKKEQRIMAFTNGNARVIVSKSSICGFGMNWQHCRNMAFVSVSYSYEKFYQAVRRSWRFGQTQEVNVHVVIAESEINVWKTVMEKSTDHEAMKDHMKYAVFAKGQSSVVKSYYNPNHKAKLPEWLF